MDLNLCISNGIVSIKLHGKRDDFDFDIVIYIYCTTAVRASDSMTASS